MISSELFNFSSLIINQKASENKYNESRLFHFSLAFPHPSNVSKHEKIQLDMEHNEIRVHKRVWETSPSAKKTYYEHHDEIFVFFVSLLKWEKYCRSLGALPIVKWTFLHKSTEKFIIIRFLYPFQWRSPAFFCHDSIHFEIPWKY